MEKTPPIEEIIRYLAPISAAQEILDKRAVLVDYVTRHTDGDVFCGDIQKLDKLEEVEMFIEGMYRFCRFHGIR